MEKKDTNLLNYQITLEELKCLKEKETRRKNEINEYGRELNDYERRVLAEERRRKNEEEQERLKLEHEKREREYREQDERFRNLTSWGPGEQLKWMGDNLPY